MSSWQLALINHPPHTPSVGETWGTRTLWTWWAGSSTPRHSVENAGGRGVPPWQHNLARCLQDRIFQVHKTIWGHRGVRCWEISSESDSLYVGRKRVQVYQPLAQQGWEVEFSEASSLLWNSSQDQTQFPSNQELREQWGLFLLNLSSLPSSYSILSHLSSESISVVITK